MLLTISHVTEYLFSEPVSYALQQLRLTPKTRSGQDVKNWDMQVSGGSVQLAYDDQNNNHVQLVSVEPGASRVEIHSHGQVETADTAGVVGAHRGYAPLWMFERTTELTAPGSNIRKFARAHTPDGSVESLHALSKAILENVEYETDTTHAATTAEQSLTLGTGVCQDHTHIFISVCRWAGIPARYVSGYLLINGQSDQVASHAWAEAHLSGLGWVGFDVSNRISPDERYVRVATGLDYKDAAPIRGVRFGPHGGNLDESLIVSIRVEQ
ncbi:MAG: transglutaminase domain-containing protein [Hyphomicrobiales bacterium]